MNFANNIAFAQAMDFNDPLRHMRDEYLFPEHNGNPYIYLCGNSLGLQPKVAKEVLDRQLRNWQNMAVEAWF